MKFYIKIPIDATNEKDAVESTIELLREWVETKIATRQVQITKWLEQQITIEKEKP